MYEIFAKLMKEDGVTPYRVSKETGVSQSVLSDWKRGRCVPKVDKLQKIADYFHVSLDYLLGNVSEPYFYLDNEKILKEINSYGDEDLEDKKNAPPLNLSKGAQEKLNTILAMVDNFTDDEWEKLMDYTTLLLSAKQNHKDD